MESRMTSRLPSYGLKLALLVAVAHLAWEQTHGGVQSHHLLNRDDLPAISNLWGLVVLPALGWLASVVVARRVASGKGAIDQALVAFIGALIFGVSLSVAFAAGYDSVTSGLFFGALLAGLVLRTYRAEYAFGFVLGMTFVFGAVLPTMVATVAAAISAVAHLLVRPLVAVAVRRARA